MDIEQFSEQDQMKSGLVIMNSSKKLLPSLKAIGEQELEDELIPIFDDEGNKHRYEWLEDFLITLIEHDRLVYRYQELEAEYQKLFE